MHPLGNQFKFEHTKGCVLSQAIEEQNKQIKKYVLNWQNQSPKSNLFVVSGGADVVVSSDIDVVAVATAVVGFDLEPVRRNFKDIVVSKQLILLLLLLLGPLWYLVFKSFHYDDDNKVNRG